jgi:hypothetical protein
MWHPWLIVFTGAELILIVVVSLALRQFHRQLNDETDVISIGLVLLIFVSVIVSMVWIFCVTELYGVF